MYGSAADLRRLSGVKARDFGDGVTDADLDDVLAQVLEQAKSLIDADRNRDYEAGGATPPPGIVAIALDMAATVIRNALATRTTAVVQINDFTVRVLTQDLLTPDVRRRLSRFPRKATFRFGSSAPPPDDDDEDGTS